MDALQRLMRPIIGIANRQIRAKTPARDLASELDGQVIAVRVRDTALAMYFQAGPIEIELIEYAEDPDVVITGSLLTLAGLATGSGDAAIRDGSLELTGNAETAQAFQQLLGYGTPDVEEELSRLIGDVAAHGIGDVARSIGRWGRDVHATLEQNVAEYLQEERGALPSRWEVDDFRQRVDTLRDDVDRFEARLRQVERSRE